MELKIRCSSCLIACVDNAASGRTRHRDELVSGAPIDLSVGLSCYSLWTLPPLFGCSLRCLETLLRAWRDELKQCKPLPAISLTVHSDFIDTGRDGWQAPPDLPSPSRGGYRHQAIRPVLLDHQLNSFVIWFIIFHLDSGSSVDPN